MVIVLLDQRIVDRQIPPQQPRLSARDYDAGSFQVNSWSINSTIIFLGFCGLVIFISAVLTLRVISVVNLVGAIRYLWVLIWAIPMEVFFIIGLFDYFDVTEVWITHWWRNPQMAWFRRSFCVPQSTYNTLCTVPRGRNETARCLLNYNATSCAAIRDAQQQMYFAMDAFCYFSASWGLILAILVSTYYCNNSIVQTRLLACHLSLFDSTIVLLFDQLLLTANALEHLISKPLAQTAKSRIYHAVTWE